MKRIYLCILPVFFFIGCAANTASKPVDAAMDRGVQEESFEKGIEYVKQGLDARQDGDTETARQAFIKACRHFDEEDAFCRTIMYDATAKLKKNITMSGFEYAPKKSFELLVVYLEMQNAYIDRDIESLRNSEVLFNATYQEVQQATVTEKQKRLEELGQEVTQKSEEIQKQAQEDIFEVYPTIYVVKKGDTLPSIAARHEIYNDSFMWPLVYKANRDQIKDPKTIYVGQDLKIPREMTMEEMIEARREAGAPEPEKIPKEANIPKRKK
ncbi:MAG: LysM peptidoglycan-binding domain-containing protein [Deltaproteobacteria bacterium]|nr:LysM peptidoglycan-binding domain-containing protein [Deltaproteobacteria bacterium]